MTEAEDPKLRAARWRKERREVAELRERIVLSAGRAEGHHTAPVAYIYTLVFASDQRQAQCGGLPVRAKRLFNDADKAKLDGMTERKFGDHVSAARHSRGIPLSTLLPNEHTTQIEMGSAHADPKVIDALWAEHEREKAKLMTAVRNAPNFRTGRKQGAKARAR